ncbi:MAG TPA: M20/M25/M40 family metallo-hydrolase [Candidatus Sumerlaeota bacterium]|nr:M20/M25/M40 family metallo-hydrolase [Candidatus Sumerlaeota bacterium]HMZ50641.1 M20/M25/M40 family metallo-hydrolase [Candidatus Sumerlaeota bacterium]HNM45588.1 M20/M25/M40 family metallo-hydrolase [Candidatus Sumerlaeota bacterium]
MSNHSLSFFKKLALVPGPSGFEEQARALWRAEVTPFCDSVETIAHGSEIATLRGKSKATSLLFMGHIDQLGLIVRYISDEGFLYFAPIGGVDPDTIISRRVRVLGPKGEIPGIIGKIAFHLQDGEERKKKLEMQDLWIDIGAVSKKEAEEYAPVGTPVVIGEEYIELLNGRVASRIDNRFGAFVVAELLRRLSKKRERLFATVHGAATVQEESSPSFTGATTVAYHLKPTAAIAVDVNHSMDIPGGDKRKFGDAKMGGGPIISIGVASSKKLIAAVRAAAEGAGIAYQVDYENGRMGTDADAMPVIRAGIPTMSIGNPLRYMHNTVEMGQISDILQVIDILEAFVLSIQEDVSYTP